MKYLMALNIAQLACLVLLLVMISGMTQTAPDSLEGTPRHVAETSRERPGSNGNQDMFHVSSPGTLDEAQLRRIIREELVAHGSLAANHVNGGAMESGTRQRNEAEDDYRADFVAQQIEYYRSVGEITPLQMQDLQTEIAKLDQVDRKQALSNLVRAMNAGEIQGHL